MGRKQQQHQRTKGNLQASSSSRAAQILQSKNVNITPTVGFSKEGAETAANVDSILSSSFRKLGKKEAVTKQKALAEILEAVSEENIEGCLPLWARNYHKISIDNERKIRELSQQVHSKIVTVAGRNLAPYLNNIMGTWLESTCDIHTGTSQTASIALLTAFPADKLTDAIKFCEKGIVKHVRERLGASPNTLSDIKVTDPVDAEEKYSRVIGSSLRTIIHVLRMTDQLEGVNSLLEDSCVWSLGRSRIPQVRKHVYNFISDLCTLRALPDTAYKTLAQQLNACSHETSTAHYSALVNVLTHHQDKFWAVVSVSDVRGQLLDALKSKALNAGVLEPILSQLAALVPIFYQRWIQEDLHAQWYEDVLNNSSKCLAQSKGPQDKLTVLKFVAAISSVIKEKFAYKMPDTALPTIGGMITTLTSSALKEDMVTPLETILQNTTDTSSTSTTILLNIKHNEYEIDNTVLMGNILLCVRVNDRETVLDYLAQRCQQQISAASFEYVSSLLEQFNGLSKVLFVKLCNGEVSELSLINLTNSLFIPHISATEYTSLQISQLCKIFLKFLPQSSPPYQNLVRILIQTTPHKTSVFHAFLKEQTRSDLQIISADLMIEMFDSLEEEQSCAEFEAIIADLSVLSSKITELRTHLMMFIEVASSENVLDNKLVTLLRHIRWNNDLGSDTATINLILSQVHTVETMTTLTPVLRKIVETCPEFSSQIMDKATEILHLNPEEITSCTSRIFNNSPAVVVNYCANKLPHLAVNMALLMDLYEKYGVLNMAKLCAGSSWAEEEVLLFKCCLDFITASSFDASLSEDTIKNLTQLIVYELYAFNGLGASSSKVLGHIKTKSEHCYSIINELIWANNMFVICVIKDLISHGFEMDWDMIEGVPSLPAGSLISLATAFDESRLKETVQSRKDGELTNEEKLCYLDFSAFTTQTTNISEVIEFLNQSCFEALDHQFTARTFRTFHHIFLSSSALEEDIEFVLCSTASMLQTTLDMVSENATTEWRYNLTAALLSFHHLYVGMRDGIKTEVMDKHKRLQEDWDVYFEPGIQDLALVLHDKILALSLADAAKYLSPVVLLAPAGSVKSFMKFVLKKNDDITFDECFGYLMSCYQTLPYETQTAMFYLLLHSQHLFPLQPDDRAETDDDDETAQFEAPPSIFLDALSQIDLLDFASESEYENRLIKATHIWTLLLLSESRRSADVLREHVEFLRSKQILSHFLDNLVYLIKFSSKRYQIVRMEKITECGRFESHQLASSCFMGVATVFPALLRSWWKKLGKELTISVEKYVTAFVSPSLIKLETNLRTNPEDETLVIKPRPVVREVVATYTMDDITADLIIYIAPNHPLSPPTVSCERQVGVPVGTWRSWMLQMTSMFQNQNSSIVDALEHWRKNMDKQFEGLESCMICFSVVQGPKKALPKPCCKTCKKKFHSACLYKWFSTSGKSTCPMCRARFQHATGLRARLQEGAGIGEEE